MALSDTTEMSLEDLPTIPELFRGCKVLITGGSGFMGKVLVEKLLRSCPQLDTVFLLLRHKRNKDPRDRINDITNVPLFDRLRNDSPGAIDKIVAVNGNVQERGLGLSDEDRDMLQREVGVIFHFAASVRFDDPIRDAILINVRGTLEVVKLALGMEKLKVLLHLSTTYCNCDIPEVVEEIYPAPGDWRTMIQIVEQNDQDHLLRCLTPKILGTLPNTYTYAKNLGEQVIRDHEHLLPVVIVRPSIVLSTYSEPMPGWIDNFNGPVGLMVGGGKGVLRSVYADPNNTGDYVPVDIAIKSIIFIAWHRALHRSQPSTPVYNCSSMTVPTTLYEIISKAVELSDDYPLDNILWFPNPTITYNRYTHYLKVIFYHMIPALIVDGILKLTGNKTMLFKLHRRIFIANMTLSIFTTKNNYFDNSKFLALETDGMKPEDKNDFSYNCVLTDRYPFMKTSLIGARIFLLKDPLSTLPHAKIHYRRMYWLDIICKTVSISTILWAVGACSIVQTICTLLVDLPQHISEF